MLSRRQTLTCVQWLITKINYQAGLFTGNTNLLNEGVARSQAAKKGE